MSENTYANIIRSTNPELWPQELWVVLLKLLQSAQESITAPMVHITARLCPIYSSPLGDNHDEFDRGLQTLATHQVLTVKWLSNGALARWVRLNADQQGVLEKLAGEFGPQSVTAKKQPLDTSVEREKLEKAIIHYGCIGLRTAAHLAFGNSHALDTVSVPKHSVWSQSDVGVSGANVLRVAGELDLRTEWVWFRTKWSLPGHFIWEHDLAGCLYIWPNQISVGECLVLIENPYPYWELLRRWRGDHSVTLVCLHGETLRMSGENSFGGALTAFLKQVYHSQPRLNTLIWCDPDPAGLVIANNAHRLVSELGGDPHFWVMEKDVLARLEKLVLAEQKLQPLGEQDKALLGGILQKRSLHYNLIPLALEMERLGMKGEQEALVVDAWKDLYDWPENFA